MKKTVFFACLLCAIGVHASGNGGVGHGDYHFGYISAAAGYSSLSQNIPNVTTKGNLSEIFGAGYQFRMNNGWCSVGLQFSQMTSKTMPDTYNYYLRDASGNLIRGIDDQFKFISGTEAVPERIDTFCYTISQTDRQVWRSLDIPIMAGYYNSGFYCGAGIKVGFSVGSYIASSGTCDFSAHYEKYNWFRSTPEFTHHLYRPYKVEETKYECKLRPQFSVLGEIGYDMLSSLSSNSKVCHMLLIGFYFEAGVRSVRPLGSLQAVQPSIPTATQGEYVDVKYVMNAKMTPYYLSTQTEGKFVAPYFVGVKLTYMIGGSWSSTATWHKGCQCYGD